MFPHGRYRDNRERQIKIGDHTLDQSQLLSVLLSEVGSIGLRDVEEFHHHGGDTPENDPGGALRKDGR